jgi:hypothetical protein
MPHHRPEPVPPNPTILDDEFNFGDFNEAAAMCEATE